jgi:hypothetical protein
MDDTARLVAPGLRSDFASVVHASADLQATLDSINALPFQITSVFAGCELAVELTDEVSHALGLPGNGIDLKHHRRDKYLMSERVRECGIRAVQQRRCSTWEECLEFIHLQTKRYEEAHHTHAHHQTVTMLSVDEAAGTTTTTTTRTVTLRNDEELPFTLVIKPARSSGSDDVYKGRSVAALRARFDQIMGKRNKLGLANDCVLLQELLEGDEFVIDTVSRDGQHKLVGAWRYIKGRANGADFVYHGMVICDGNDPVIQQVYEYTKGVLDALDIRNGAGHAEIMYNSRMGPCLVEIGARLHGGEGIFMPVATKLFGYHVIDVLSAAARSKAEFDAYPDMCTLDGCGFGAVVDLICYQTGVFKKINEEADRKMRSMESFMGFACLPEPGTKLTPTVDMFSSFGCVLLLLAGKEPSPRYEEVVMGDIARIREYERELYDSE